MNAAPKSPPPRIGLFRLIAVARYRAPIEVDSPLVLNPWRVKPLWLAAAIVLAVALTWYL